MRISKRFTLAVSAAALALTMSAAAQAASHGGMKKIVIGTEGAYPPFNNLESDGSLVGFDIDIAKALCEEMKVECEFVTQDWDGIIPALIAGKFDAIIASMSITDERKEKVDFTDKYYNTPPAIAEYKLDIDSGRVDAVIDDVIVLTEWLKSDAGTCCKLLGTLTPDPVINGEGAGIAIRKGETELRDMFNTAIAAIRENGTYKTINDKYFDVDVYGD